MNNTPNPKKNFSFSINNKIHHEDIFKFGKALHSLDRILILELLQGEPRYLIEISKELSLPLSSVSRHIDILAEAGLIFVSYEPGPKGHSKLCSKATLSAEIMFEDLVNTPLKASQFTVEMPIGLYHDCNVTAPCGMISAEEPLGVFDNPSVFFSVDRPKAELIWFNMGEISYKFPITFPHPHDYEEIIFSFEICSETVYHRNKWPSDITVCINDIEICTFTSPGDFGGRRGKYTPAYWPIHSTQYGVLMKFAVNSEGVFVNGFLKNTSTKISDLNLKQNDFVKFTLSIKKDAIHKGGLNLFGKGFGDHPQDIIMAIQTKNNSKA